MYICWSLRSCAYVETEHDVIASLSFDDENSIKHRSAYVLIFFLLSALFLHSFNLLTQAFKINFMVLRLRRVNYDFENANVTFLFLVIKLTNEKRLI